MDHRERRWPRYRLPHRARLLMLITRGDASHASGFHLQASVTYEKIVQQGDVL